MQLGIPRVGIEEFNREPKKYDIADKTLYAILTMVADEAGAIKLDNETIVYADDIRADYTSMQMYVAVYRNDYIFSEELGREVKYRHRLEKYMLWENGKWVGPEDLVFKLKHSKDTWVAHEINKLELKDKVFSGHSLFRAYIKSAYDYFKDDFDYTKYSKVRKASYNKKDKVFMVEHNLDFYGNYVDTEYRDVRDWGVGELLDKFGSEAIGFGDSKGARRLGFELMLIFDLYYLFNNESVIEADSLWEHGSVEEMLADRQEYMKYKEEGIYLIFKGRWFESCKAYMK